MRTRIVRPGDTEWPQGMSELGPLDPPKQLFCRGKEIDPDRYHVGIVGTRRATAAGLEVAADLAAACVGRGLVVVSGMARGIDSMAHRAALEASGHTIAVLGSGVDVCFPKRNAVLHRTLSVAGTLVSEYPDAVQPQAWHFPRRNRIIVGLCQAVIVVEGGFKSGALITARIAIDAGRDVIAVPGSARNPMSAGPNELIRTGQAALATTIDHLFEEIGVAAEGERRPSPVDVGGLDELSTGVLFLMDDIPIGSAFVSDQLRVRFEDVLECLSGLEVRGLVVKRLGGYELSRSGRLARTALLGAGSESA